MTDEVSRRLDRVIFLLSLAFADEIESARQRVLSDAVASAILSAAEEIPIPAGELKKRVAAATKQSERTVGRRIAQLVATGWLTSEGSGPSVRYKAIELS